MDSATVAEALRQVMEGDDFYGPKPTVSRVTADNAVKTPATFPYSIATNALHTVFWNRIWLARLQGKKRPNILEDWRVPDAEEWSLIRQDLVKTVEDAHKIASSKPFVHAMKSDEAACKTLLAIAVHTAYHLGQINLIKRVARKRAQD